MKLLDKIKRWMPTRASDKREGEQLHVTRRGSLLVRGDRASLDLAGVGAFEAELLVKDAGIVVAVSKRESFTSNLTTVERRFDLSQASQAAGHFHRQVADWRRQLGAGNGWAGMLKGAALGVGGTIAIGMLIAPSSAPSAAQAPMAQALAAQAQYAAAQPSTAQSTGSEAAAEQGAAAVQPPAVLTSEEASKVAKAARIEMASGNKQLVAFSDPNCPACQALERQADKFEPGYGFTVIPVAYKDGSRDKAAAALCSKDPAASWRKVINGELLDTPPCKRGYEQLDANKALFEAIGATATPTLVSPKGSLAAGSAEAKALMTWLAAN